MQQLPTIRAGLSGGEEHSKSRWTNRRNEFCTQLQRHTALFAWATPQGQPATRTCLLGNITLLVQPAIPLDYPSF